MQDETDDEISFTKLFISDSRSITYILWQCMMHACIHVM